MQKEVRWKLIMLSILGICLLNFPVIQLFSQKIIIAGLPLLYGYILLVWLLFIWALYQILDRPDKDKPVDPHPK
jgi:hypothetical protein